MQSYQPDRAQPPIVRGRLPRAGSTDPITVLELCGGLLSGLSAILANGIYVSEVFLCDTSLDAHSAARYHFIRLRQQYPSRLLASGISDVLPQDLMVVTASDLISAGLHRSKFLLVTCGWPCNGWSRAGRQGGAPPGLLEHLDSLLRLLSRLRLGQRGAKPLAYMLENVAFDLSSCEKPVLADYRAACRFWGAPLRVDDARFDAPTHAERLIWTNLTYIRVLGASIDAWTRDHTVAPSSYLDPHRTLRLASSYDGPGAFGVRYPCNVRGKPLRALPTLVAFEKADAFRGDRDGVYLTTAFLLLPPCIFLSPILESALASSGSWMASLLAPTFLTRPGLNFLVVAFVSTLLCLLSP